MYLDARFKAIKWQRSVIYTSYSYGVFIDRHGTITQLPLNGPFIKKLVHGAA